LIGEGAFAARLLDKPWLGVEFKTHHGAHDFGLFANVSVGYALDP
jgi:hypothetical protein